MYKRMTDEHLRDFEDKARILGMYTGPQQEDIRKAAEMLREAAEEIARCQIAIEKADKELKRWINTLPSPYWFIQGRLEHIKGILDNPEEAER